MACLCRHAFVGRLGAMTFYRYFDSPMGPMLLAANAAGLCGSHFVGEKYFPEITSAWQQRDSAVLSGAAKQLDEYFAGTRTQFDLPLAAGGTPFQRQVWTELTHIAFGERLTYGELARRVGLPNGSRAVGAANGRNPISIIVPCHRVVGSDGSLTGYAGGLDKKRQLLDLETRYGSPTELVLG